MNSGCLDGVLEFALTCTPALFFVTVLTMAALLKGRG